MSGFDNDILYADNVDFSGTNPVSGQINQDGELLVGSSVAPNIRSYVPTGSNGVDINVGQGTLDFSLSNIPSSALQDSTISITAGTGISVVGSPVSLGGNVTISSTGGGTVDQYEVVVGSTSNTLTSVGPGSAGQVLQSGGAAANPAYSTATYPSTAGSSGKILISDGTNIISSTPTYPNAASTSGKVVISDGTNFVTSTPTFPNASASSGKFIRSDGTNWIASTPTLPTTAGTAGKVLISDATNYIESTPTFPNASATSGKIIKSDGTNWVASTETYAAPSTSGNIMTSDGTNWTSATSPVGTMRYIEVTLTSAQIKALHATPIQVIAAPGANRAIIVAHCYATMTYGGTNVFTAGAAQTVVLYWGTALAVSNAPGVTNAMLVSASSTIQYGAGSIGAGSATTSKINAAVNLYNPSVTEITGNAANNNTISFGILYYVVNM